MKISKDTGRGENIAGLVLWVLFIILYYCAISGKTQFSASIDEIEEYRGSASKLGIFMPDRFPAEIDIVEYPDWPDALYLVVTKEEAARIQKEGLQLAGMKEGVREHQSPHSRSSGSGNNSPQRFVFTTARIFTSMSCTDYTIVDAGSVYRLMLIWAELDNPDHVKETIDNGVFTSSSCCRTASRTL